MIGKKQPLVVRLAAATLYSVGYTVGAVTGAFLAGAEDTLHRLSR